MRSRLIRWSALLIVATFSWVASAADSQASDSARAATDGYRRMKLGTFEITALSDGEVLLPLAELVAIEHREVTTAALRRDNAQMQPTSVNAFLISMPGRLVLIDAGDPPGLRPGLGRLQANLRAAGYSADQVDAVLLTHLHRDHVGGLSNAGKASFPNAEVWIERREAAYWLDDAMADAPEPARTFARVARDALRPYRDANKLRLFDATGAELMPGIRTHLAAGHTPGHTAFLVESAGQHLLLWGDLVHIPQIQFERPEVGIAFDVDLKAARQRRLAILGQAARGRWWVGASHIAFPGLGHVRREGAGFTWVPIGAP
jgi:glyoxylase-like metal-dependent hydrolase (beta-lactamase superfamily II)